MEKFIVGVPIKVTNVETGEIRLFLSMSEASKTFGVSQTTISGYAHGYRKNLFKSKYKIVEAKTKNRERKIIPSKIPNPTYVRKMSHTIYCKRIKDNKIYSFDTMVETASFFAVVPATIYKYCKNGKLFKGKYILTKS